MGYHSINKVEIRREDRKIVVDAYCEELQRHFVETFVEEDLDKALEHAKRKLSELSM